MGSTGRIRQLRQSGGSSHLRHVRPIPTWQYHYRRQRAAWKGRHQRGGSGTKLTGTIPAQDSPYVLTVNVAGGGGGGLQAAGSEGGAGGTSGYAPGARGGSLPSGRGKSSGGGGGGASAVTSTSKAISIVAPGGGGSGGGAYDSSASGNTGANRRGGQGGDLIAGTVTDAALAGDDGGNGALGTSALRGGAGAGGAIAAGGAGGTGGNVGGGGNNGGFGSAGSTRQGGRGGNGGALGNVAGGGGAGGGHFGGGGGGGSATATDAMGVGQSAGGAGSGSALVNGAGTATVASANNHGAGVEASPTKGASGGVGNPGGAGTVILGCDDLPVVAPSAFSDLSTPEYTEQTEQQVTLSGTIQPAAAGRPVTLRTRNSGGGTTDVDATTADADGNFTFTTTVDEATNFEFRSVAQTVGDDTYLAATSDSFRVRSTRMFDDFNYTDASQMQPKWFLRSGTQDYATAPDAKRRYTKASFDAIDFQTKNGATEMVFSYVRDGVDPNNGKPRYKVPHITVGKLGTPSESAGLVYGNLEARIKFHRRVPQGALWWQSGYSDQGNEFDVVEWFGDRNPGSSSTQNLQHTVHTGPNGVGQRLGNTWTGGSLGTGGPGQTVFNYTNFGPNDSWWSEYHDIRGEWSANNYKWYIDGIHVGTIGPGNGITPASIPGEVILSMAANNGGSYNDLQSFLSGGGDLSSLRMWIDWVRVWK